MEQSIGLLIMLVVLAILMTFAFRKAKKELQQEEALKNAENAKILAAHTMPCGVVVDDEHLLKATDEDFGRFDKTNLGWLINYVGHKLEEFHNDESWRSLMDRITTVRNAIYQDR